MSYQIIYEPDRQKRYPVSLQRNAARKWILPAVLLLLIVILLANPVTISALKELILPGDPVVTEVALENLSGNIENGMTAKEAIVTFCLEIYEGANLE